MSGRRYVGRPYVSRPYVGRPYVGRPIVLVPTEATRGLNMNMFTGVNLCLRQRRRPTNSREDSQGDLKVTRLQDEVRGRLSTEEGRKEPNNSECGIFYPKENNKNPENSYYKVLYSTNTNKL